MSTPNEFPNLALIRQGVDYRFKIKCRGLELTMRPLSLWEEDQVTQEVVDALAELPEQRRTSLRQSALVAVKRMQLGQTSDVGKSDHKVSSVELEKMTPGEIDYLTKKYAAECDKLNPMIERLSPAELDQIVNALKKNTKDRETTLIESSFFQLVDLCLYLLSQGESPEGS